MYEFDLRFLGVSARKGRGLRGTTGCEGTGAISVITGQGTEICLCVTTGFLSGGKNRGSGISFVYFLGHCHPSFLRTWQSLLSGPARQVHPKLRVIHSPSLCALVSGLELLGRSFSASVEWFCLDSPYGWESF